jgi:putative spermidine/putrescine transport system substrate-binding protein
MAALICGCVQGQSSLASPSAPSSALDSGSNRPSAPALHGADDALIKAAQGEGSLTVIGLARDRCNYARIIDTFSHKFELAVDELEPTASPADQLQAISGTVGGAAAPDVVDLSMAAAQAAKAGLLAPFKVSTWSSIPAGAKAPDGAWTGNYYGVLSFELNTTVVPTVPKSWADLLGAPFKGRIALAGDPRSSGDGAYAVYSAALANGGSLNDARKGLDLFKQLEVAGNLLPRLATPATIEDGQTPVTMRWTYESMAHRDAAAGATQIEVAVPATGRLAVANAQAINARAQHPNAARLWLEFLYSDQGQNLFLKGLARPVRADAMEKAGTIDKTLLAALPTVSGTPVLPTNEQSDKLSAYLGTNWAKAVS